MLRIREHLAVHLLFDCLRVIRQVDAVSEAFAHLCFSVHAGQTPLGLILGDHGLRQDQRFPVDLVEFFHNLARLLNHRKLVFSNRDDRRVKRGDIRSL